jgi:hypothetical protein
MIGPLAGKSAGEICREILRHEHEVQGMVVFVFTDDRSLTWGSTGMISSMGMMVALQLLHAEATKLNAMITIEAEGNA